MFITIRVCFDFIKKERARYLTMCSRLMTSQSHDFTVVSPIPEDRDHQVLALLRNNFYADEPLNKAIGLSKKGEPHKDFDAMNLATLKDRISVMVVDKATDKLAAVSVNGVFLPGDIAKKKKLAETVTCDKLGKILTLLVRVNEPLNLFHKFDVDKIFDVSILSTDFDYRRKGLIGKMLKASEDLARKNDFKLIKADATGAFSQRSFASAGFESVYEIKYADYLDENKQQIFQIEAPHESIKLMVKVIK